MSEQNFSTPGEVNEVVDDELMAMFVEVAGSDKGILADALAAEDFAAIRSKVHEVKGYAASFGFPGISQQAAEIQGAVDEGRIEDARTKLQALLQEMEQIIPA